MKTRFFRLLFALLIICSSVGYATAQKEKEIEPAEKGTWQHIGTATVGFKTDRDVVVVTGADAFRKLKFKVKDAKIEILDMDVIFENEEHQDIQVRSIIERGGESRVIDLKGNSRRIKRVAFVYKTIPGFNFEKAEVTLWGEK
ncbi:hypothetical protein FRZ67_14550 [Panacibacter ginsenosidivorans]|uniref:DUF2541 family protein n=1 Tax=Panacibacter ginsenosidivorans TaxID=1813871 RepID=A0A5B8VCQ8_9BACT|nr:hypothetical protein [Panacibacter ginsenosidivorans]QEC68466.1 hypothetical protein FRZ67_14550 [Panacibacter ginsenosidivorans]